MDYTINCHCQLRDFKRKFINNISSLFYYHYKWVGKKKKWHICHFSYWKNIIKDSRKTIYKLIVCYTKGWENKSGTRRSSAFPVLYFLLCIYFHGSCSYPSNSSARACMNVCLYVYCMHYFHLLGNYCRYFMQQPP